MQAECHPFLTSKYMVRHCLWKAKCTMHKHHTKKKLVKNDKYKRKQAKHLQEATPFYIIMTTSSWYGISSGTARTMLILKIGQILFCSLHQRWDALLSHRDAWLCVSSSILQDSVVLRRYGAAQGLYEPATLPYLAFHGTCACGNQEAIAPKNVMKAFYRTLSPTIPFKTCIACKHSHQTCYIC